MSFVRAGHLRARAHETEDGMGSKGPALSKACRSQREFVRAAAGFSILVVRNEIPMT